MRRSAKLQVALLASLGLHLAAAFWFGWLRPARASDPQSALSAPAPLKAELAWVDVVGPPAPPWTVAASEPRPAPAKSRTRAPLASAGAGKQPRESAPDAAGSLVGHLVAGAAQRVELKQFAEAGELLELCLNTEPRNADCHLLKGKIHGSQHEYAEEAIEYRAFLRFAPASHPDRWWVRDVYEESPWGGSAENPPAR